MAQIAAETALQLALHQLLPIYAQHVRGILNDIADRLSRMSKDNPLPAQLRNCQRLVPVSRNHSTFRAWPKVNEMLCNVWYGCLLSGSCDPNCTDCCSLGIL